MSDEPTKDEDAVADAEDEEEEEVDAFEGINQDIDTDDFGVMTLESVCMNCHEDGITTLFPTHVPFFKEVFVMSFCCKACGLKNNELQSASEIQPQGCRLELTVSEEEVRGRGNYFLDSVVQT